MDSQMIPFIIQGTLDTFRIVIFATLFAYIVGLPLGLVLIITGKGGIKPVPVLSGVLGFVINILRSIPFLILIVAVVPFTRLMVGTAIGTPASIVPLVIAAFPFVARVVESSIKEVDGGVIEAAQSMGASTWRIVFRVMLPEARPSLILGAAIAFVTILGYSVMSGAVGGGGLGAIAINYGHYRSERAVMWVTIVIMVVIVQVFQEMGMRISVKGDKRNR